MKPHTTLVSFLALTPSVFLPLTANTGSAPPNTIFEEIDGTLTVEAEHFRSQTKNDIRSWHIVTETKEPKVTPDGDPNHAATASGKSYLEILPDTRRSHGDKLIHGENFTNTPGKVGILTYKAYFNNPGRYYCWVRTYSTNTEDNGIHLGINGTWPESGRRMQWTAKNKWHWDSKQRTAKVHVGVFGQIWIDVPKPGLHDIQFSMREDGFEFDQFVLTKEKPDAAYPPGTSKPAAPKVAKTPAAQKRQDFFLTAKDFTTTNGFYLARGGQWLAINPDHNQSAETRSSFSLPSGRYDLTLLAVGENDGLAPHEVFINDTSVLKHTTPLAEKAFDDDSKFHGVAKNLQINLGDVILVKSSVHSADGKEYSRARWAGLRFNPADAATAKAALQRDAKAAPKKAKKIAPNLQQPREADGKNTAVVSGTKKQWQPLTVTFDGPFAHEKDTKPNPFTDYEFTVEFTHESGAPVYTVPGYFAADGNAAESSAQAGTKWRAHLSPDKPGEWFYKTSFKGAKNIPSTTGGFTITAAAKDAPGFYGEGRLTYVGGNLLQLSGSKRYFLKAGADAPETLLAYTDFDGTVARKKNVPLKTWSPHLQDWKSGDPTWKGGKGKGLIGALNYLADKGVNAFSFLTYNAGGDGDNVWPFISRDEKFNYDCSKLDQWNIIFEHAQKKGLFLHFKLQETEMDDNNRGHDNGKRAKMGHVPTSLDGGALGPERKLYLREMVARYGHHLALNWNMGEENTQTTQQLKDQATYLRELDPYDHHLVVHTFPDAQDTVYKPLLGSETLTGVSLQNSHLKNCHKQVVKWVNESNKAGKPWAVAFDEPGNASVGMPADPDYPGMENYKGPTIHNTRSQTLWGTLMGGGWGVEYYFGYKLPQNDLICEDWRSRDQSWDYAGIALEFFKNENVPIHELKPADELVGNPEHWNWAYCMAKKGYYLVFLDGSKEVTLKPLEGDKPKTIQWFNVRTGAKGFSGELQNLKLKTPDQNDWVAIIQ